MSFTLNILAFNSTNLNDALDPSHFSNVIIAVRIMYKCDEKGKYGTSILGSEDGALTKKKCQYPKVVGHSSW